MSQLDFQVSYYKISKWFENHMNPYFQLYLLLIAMSL